MKQGELSSADRALGRALGRGDELVQHLVALTSQALAQGHVCLRISAPEVLEAVRALSADFEDLPQIVRTLEAHPAVRKVAEGEPSAAWEPAVREGPPRVAFGSPVAVRPLVLDSSLRLYLARYYDHEQRLARAVVRLLRARSSSVVDVEPRLTAGLDSDQARALASALSGGLTIVSGGPGTGKTSTVVRILAALFEQSRRERGVFPRVKLLAPTGKAAVRLSEAISAAKKRLDAPSDVIEALPEQGSTIHRALGVLPRSRTRFRHGLESPLDVDVVVVDEASMVDLALMRHLFEALPKGASVLLLGDRDQLSSVDAGNVLAELCDALEVERDSARGALCQLTQSHRFGGGGLGPFASAARAGDVVRTREALVAKESGVRLIESARGAEERELTRLAVQAFRKIAVAPDAKVALAQLTAFRVLCAHRVGSYGVTAVNQAIQDALTKERLIATGMEYFHGRPILVTETDPVMELMNGDVGLVWTEPGKSPAVLFERPGREPLSIAPAHLPSHETAFAMTIHKSQGSEFEHVVIVLPPAESPLATRELLYTAITRARRQVTLIGDPAALEVGLGREVQRASGLARAILTELRGGEPSA